MLVYKITNKINNKCYIGITERTIEERLYEHIQKSKLNENRHLYNAMNKYGLDNFDVSVLEDNILSYKELLEKEKYYISVYDSYNNGYNMTLGGDVNPMNCDKAKDKHDNVMRKEETRNKISTTMKQKAKDGELFSDEHKKHLSESATGSVYFYRDGMVTHTKDTSKMNELLNSGWTRYEKGEKFATKDKQPKIFDKRSIKVYCIVDGVKYDFDSILDASLWWYDTYKPFGETYSYATYKRKILKSISGGLIEYSIPSKSDYKLISNIIWYKENK